MKFVNLAITVFVCTLSSPMFAQSGHWIFANYDSLEVEGFVVAPNNTLYRSTWDDLLITGHAFSWERSDDESLTWVRILDGDPGLISDSIGTVFCYGSTATRSIDGGESWN